MGTAKGMLHIQRQMDMLALLMMALISGLMIIVLLYACLCVGVHVAESCECKLLNPGQQVLVCSG